ncbi:MAG: MurR/RpiR family transcriptional regulator [Oscillospiraceae bacterium]|nr:MurR/RpiR family transcriptional regulator [Oscillospiraceae bacterium]
MGERRENYYLILNNLNEQESGVVTSIISHIEKGGARVGISQVAAENYVSTSFIVKLCKKLGFAGYTDLFYHLQKNGPRPQPDGAPPAAYPADQYKKFCDILYDCRDKNGFAVGEGFGDIVADYITQRLAICGFRMFNGVHFYDYMIFREQGQGGRQIFTSNVSPSFIFAVSQSGETEKVLDNVRRAKQQGFRVISFTRVPDSALASLSDALFVIDPVRQVLVAQMPNVFFGKVILLFEQMLSDFLLGS